MLALSFTLCTVIAGTALMGITAGALGSFALLRRQSLLGDALSHAALPGVIGAVLLTGSAHPALLLGGGACACIIAALFMVLVHKTTTLKQDAILGMTLSVFFGFGLVLMTIMQKQAVPQSASASRFLFGNAATLLAHEVYIMMGVSVAVLVSLLLLWKEFQVLTFDAAYAHTLGYSTTTLTILLTLLLVLTIVIGLYTVGVILMSTLLIAPAAAARQWTKRLSSMVLLSCIFGAFSSVVGSVASSMINHMPTGPAIVIVASIIVGISLVCAPNKERSYEHAS